MSSLSKTAQQFHRGTMPRPRRTEVPIDRVDVSAYLIPTDFPESDGTLQWHHTTLVVIDASAGGRHGLGYSYADLGTAHLINEMLIDVVYAWE